jgi:(heptosyl)LPS beta-1,4-glucosyltransferase
MRGAGWSRDRVLRFFRRDCGRYDDRAVHEEVALAPGRRAGTCVQRLDHHTYCDWEETFERLTLYSTRGAADAAVAGKRVPLRRLVTAPPARFARQYLLQAGFRDGVHGLVLCGLGGVGAFLKLAKLRLGETRLAPVGASAEGRRRLEVVKGPPAADDIGTDAHAS